MIAIERWPSLTRSDVEKLNETTEQMHHAVQYIAMAGKYFIPDRPDDSHTNMAWDIETRRFLGCPILASQVIRLTLQPEALSLILLDDEEEDDLISLPLAGLTRKETLSRMKSILMEFGLDTSRYDLDLHYELPDPPLLLKEAFSEIKTEDALAFVAVRSMAELVLQDRLERMGKKVPVRTWPHHFDHAAYLPLGEDEKGELKSIGMGMAIADEMVDDYYFYINHWHREKEIDYSDLAELPFGSWRIDGWKGAVLPLHTILEEPDPAEQQAVVNSFFNVALPATLQLID